MDKRKLFEAEDRLRRYVNVVVTAKNGKEKFGEIIEIPITMLFKEYKDTEMTKKMEDIVLATLKNTINKLRDFYNKREDKNAKII